MAVGKIVELLNCLPDTLGQPLAHQGRAVDRAGRPSPESKPWPLQPRRECQAFCRRACVSLFLPPANPKAEMKARLHYRPIHASFRVQAPRKIQIVSRGGAARARLSPSPKTGGPSASLRLIRHQQPKIAQVMLRRPSPRIASPSDVNNGHALNVRSDCSGSNPQARARSTVVVSAIAPAFPVLPSMPSDPALKTVSKLALMFRQIQRALQCELLIASARSRRPRQLHRHFAHRD